MADAGKGTGITYSLLKGVQTGMATMEISVEVPQKAESRSATRSISTTIRHILKGTYIYIFHIDTCSFMFVDVSFIKARN